MLNCRTTLWYLTFVGMGVNYMIRVNMNMAIVAMVKQKKVTKSVVKAECSDSFSTYENSSKIYTNGDEDEWSNKSMNFEEKPHVSMESTVLRFLAINFDENGFDWNEHDQGLVLGSFYWLYWLTQVPGGILSKKYGPKLVYGLANFISSLLCFLMPFASYLSFEFLIVLRVVQGVIAGPVWPSMHTMTASWIPPNERSTFVTAYLGSSFSVFMNYIIFGAIISWSCWENVFHFCGIYGTLWYLAWCYYAYDTPAKHPRITPEEKQHIETSLGTTVHDKNYSIPWKKIATSRVVWMILLAQWGGINGLYTLMTQAPTYFKYIHGWDIKMSGFLSGLPHLARIGFAILFSRIADYLLQSNKMSRTNVRKVGTAFCTIINGIFVTGLAFSGCNSYAAIIFLVFAVGVHGAVTTGPLAAVVDIAPNFAGVILGIAGVMGLISGFISPIIVGLLTFENQTAKQWEIVFLLTSGLLIFSGVLYCLFADSKLQSWNSPESDSKTEDKTEINENETKNGRDDFELKNI